jgi:leucyl/phenylalanyl-tRNA---protein transferase
MEYRGSSYTFRTMHTPALRLPWLEPGDPFPPVHMAWGPATEAAGLLAAGGALDVSTLQTAYAQGIFPWYSAGQPVLWWSPNPRMVLQVEHFRLHRSLRKTLAKFSYQPSCELRIDHDFAAVISACANARREGQAGTWIVQDMQDAYCDLHAAGHAHSVETWVDGKLTGGLYCTNVGGAVFGESMFSRASDASKIALSGLVALCRAHGVVQIDCQQNTAHLASLGATEMPREAFCAAVALAVQRPAPTWRFDPLYWQYLLQEPSDNPLGN